MKNRDRGAIGVSVVASLVLVEVVIIVSVIGGSLQQDLTLQRIDTNKAFYAAEGGAAMAIREAWISTDEDGDGSIGGISDDGNAANNPQIGGATVSVSQSAASGVTSLVAVGRAERARRRIELSVQGS